MMTCFVFTEKRRVVILWSCSCPSCLGQKSERMSQEIPKGIPRFVHQFVGNGHLFSFLKPFETNPLIGKLNNVYVLAPLTKWGLSVVPLIGIFQGYPAPQNIDVNTSMGLACTGFVWTFYALMITPQDMAAKMLAAVNFAMANTNAYNAYRAFVYRRAVAAAAAVGAVGSDEKV